MSIALRSGYSAGQPRSSLGISHARSPLPGKHAQQDLFRGNGGSAGAETAGKIMRAPVLARRTATWKADKLAFPPDGSPAGRVYAAAWRENAQGVLVHGRRDMKWAGAAGDQAVHPADQSQKLIEVQLAA